MRPFIGDGYDRTFFIQGEDQLYPPCRFSGRQMAHHQAARVLREATADPDKSDEVYAAAIADRLTGWSYQDNGQWKPFDNHDGSKLTINAKHVGGLPYGLFSRLRDVMLGIAAPDVDPEAKGQPTTLGDDAKN